MNPAEPAPTPADDQQPSDVARRVGPPIAVGALVVLAALLAWLALAPTAIAGDLRDAPFTVPATLVVPPDDQGCLDVVAGDGAVTTHCLDELASDGDRQPWVEVTFAADGTVEVVRDGPDGRTVLRVDPDSGAVLDREEFGPGDEEPFPERPVDAPPDPGSVLEVYTDGDLVRQFDPEGSQPGGEQQDDPVVLDLEAPPGYRLQDAALSPDGAWVVVTTPDDQVVVAPTDGTAAPHVWAEVPAEVWVNLRQGIHWDQ